MSSSHYASESALESTSVVARAMTVPHGSTHDQLLERLQFLEHENRQLTLNCRRLSLDVKRLQRLVYLDSLTGLGNRRCFDLLLDSEIRRSVRTGAPLSLLLCDVDYFKQYNDTYGHRCGDDALVRIAGVLASVCRRGGERAARIGGEEFALILPNVDEHGAAHVARTLRSEVVNLGIRHERSLVAEVVTVSVGATTFRASTLCRPDLLLSLADAAMYEAKRAGRNRCCARHAPRDASMERRSA